MLADGRTGGAQASLKRLRDNITIAPADRARDFSCCWSDRVYPAAGPYFTIGHVSVNSAGTAGVADGTQTTMEHYFQTVQKLKRSAYVESAGRANMKEFALNSIPLDLEPLVAPCPAVHTATQTTATTSPVAVPETRLWRLLKGFQVKGVKWMQSREAECGFGMLLDEQGVGKTIQTIALIEACQSEPLKQPATLVVVPLQVLNQWRKEITSHTRLRVLVNHGSTRAASAAEFGDYDIVLTTYDTVLCDYKSGTDIIKSSRGKGKRPERAEQVTAKKRPLATIQSAYKWILSGTPIQNRLLEGKTLLHFLGVRVDYEEGCTATCRANAANKAALRAAFHEYTLRRTKRQVADDLKNLPGRIITTVDVLLTGDDLQLYKEVEAATKIVQNKYLKAGTYLKIKEGKGRHAVMLRLRQVVSHPDQLRHDSVWGPACRGGKWMMVKALEHEVGRILLGDNPDYLSDDEVSASDTLGKNSGERKVIANAKLEAMYEQLKEHLNADPTTKALIFSGFVGFLQVAQQYLNQQGVKSVLYTGQKGLPERERALQAFKSEDGLPVLLISLKAGSTGLNLITANLVLIAEPDWNPTHEMQAMDRVHRIGQKRAVKVYRYVTKGSIEEEIDERQVEKKELAMSVYGCN